jgi:hypothetical protein
MTPPPALPPRGRGVISLKSNLLRLSDFAVKKDFSEWDQDYNFKEYMDKFFFSVIQSAI